MRSPPGAVTSVEEKKKSALAKIKKLQKRTAELQFELYAEQKHSLLICLQAPDETPEPTVDIDEIRRKYHEAVADAKDDRA